MSYGLLNYALFQAGWFACVLGAARGVSWWGPAFVVLFLLIHFSFVQDRRAEVALLLIVGALGPWVDVFLVRFGAYSFHGNVAVPWLAPPWIISLWIILAATLRHSLRWLSGRYVLAAVLGAVASPMSYMAGQRLGALRLGDERAQSVIAMGLAWSIALPGVVWLSSATPAWVHRAWGHSS